MNTEEKIKKINKKLDEINSEIKEAMETVVKTESAKKEDIQKKISSAKGNLEASKEKMKKVASEGKGIASGELDKAKKSLEAAKNKIEEKKDAIDKARMEKYIENKLDYAEASIELAIFAAREAKLAYLEALEGQIEYDEKYRK